MTSKTLKTPKAARAPKAAATSRAAAAAEAKPPKAATGRADSKLARVIAMLRTPRGATIAAISAETGWQAHSVRGAMSGAIKKKLGLTITSDKVDGVRIYRIAPEAAA